MNKVGSTSLATTLLVFLVLILVGTTMFYFISTSSNASNKISSGVEINRVYERQQVVDFYTQTIFDRASRNIQSEEEFILEARRLLTFHRIEDKFFTPELSQINEQLSNANLVEDRIEIELDLEISDSFKRNEREVFSISHKYTKKFVSNI